MSLLAMLRSCVGAVGVGISTRHVFACLRISGRSVWPVAVLHGVVNAFVHVNRLGVEVQPSLLKAAALAFAPLPLCVYGAILLRKQRFARTQRFSPMRSP